MKKLFFINYVLFFGSFVFSQKTSWVTYFPAQNDLIGQICTGKDVNNLLIYRDIEQLAPTNDIQKEYRSYSTLDNEQRKSLAMRFGKAFDYEGVKVSNINAKGIHLDRLNPDALGHITPGNQFVYAGLRADSVVIEFSRSKRASINPKEIALMIEKSFPTIDLKKIETLLDGEINTSNNKSFKVTLSDPSVYFMLQMASIEIEHTESLRGKESIAVFGSHINGKQNTTIDRFTITANQPTSGRALVPTDCKGADIALTLRYQNGNLVLRFQKPDLKGTKDEILVFEDDRLIDIMGKFIIRYPYCTTDESIKFKEVYLFIDASKKENSYEIFNMESELNFPTRISYPSSILLIKNWRQR